MCQKCGQKAQYLRQMKMSKTFRNVVEPMALVEKYGADTARLFCLFAAPPDSVLEWSEAGVEGCSRFLGRLYRLVQRFVALPADGTPPTDSAQADLRPCYDRARVFIAPVRFAGGVPVKVIEAAAQGIPVVASAILQRQLGWQDGRDIQGARDAEAFARAIARLLDDDAHRQAQQAAAWARCEADYHPDDFARQVHRLLLGEPTQEHA